MNHCTRAHSQSHSEAHTGTPVVLDNNQWETFKTNLSSTIVYYFEITLVWIMMMAWYALVGFGNILFYIFIVSYNFLKTDCKFIVWSLQITVKCLYNYRENWASVQFVHFNELILLISTKSRSFSQRTAGHLNMQKCLLSLEELFQTYSPGNQQLLTQTLHK